MERKWHGKFHVATTETQVSELARDRGIIFFEFRRMLGQPIFNFAMSLGFYLREANTALASGIPPSHFTHALNLVFSSRQSKQNVEGPRLDWLFRHLYGHPAFAEICGDGLLFVLHTPYESDWDFHQNANIAATFAFHQGSRGSEAGFGPLHRDGFVKDEMRTQIKSAAHCLNSIENGYGYRPLVAESAPGATQNVGGDLFPVTVHDDCLEAAARQLADSSLSIADVFHVNFEIAEDPPKYPQDLVVGTENQGL
jgi:hypothetical protein